MRYAIGDRVIVAKRIVRRMIGWHPDMDAMIGKAANVTGAHEATATYKLDNISYVFPEECLIRAPSIQDTPVQLMYGDTSIQIVYDDTPTQIAAQLKEKQMKIETNVTLINSSRAATLSDDTIISYITQLEDQIAQLEKTKTRPKKLQAKIDKMRSQIAQLVEIVDGRPDQ